MDSKVIEQLAPHTDSESPTCPIGSDEHSYNISDNDSLEPLIQSQLANLKRSVRDISDRIQSINRTVKDMQMRMEEQKLEVGLLRQIIFSDSSPNYHLYSRLYPDRAGLGTEYSEALRGGFKRFDTKSTLYKDLVESEKKNGSGHRFYTYENNVNGLGNRLQELQHTINDIHWHGSEAMPVTARFNSLHREVHRLAETFKPSAGFQFPLHLVPECPTGVHELWKSFVWSDSKFEVSHEESFALFMEAGINHCISKFLLNPFFACGDYADALREVYFEMKDRPYNYLNALQWRSATFSCVQQNLAADRSLEEELEAIVYNKIARMVSDMVPQSIWMRTDDSHYPAQVRSIARQVLELSLAIAADPSELIVMDKQYINRYNPSRQFDKHSIEKFCGTNCEEQYFKGEVEDAESKRLRVEFVIRPGLLRVVREPIYSGSVWVPAQVQLSEERLEASNPAKATE